MCSVRCRKSTKKQCRCECGGLYHGAEVSSREERREYLLRKYPPCTPVRITDSIRKKVYRGRVKNIQVFNEVVVALQSTAFPFSASTIQLDEKDEKKFGLPV